MVAATTEATAITATERVAAGEDLEEAEEPTADRAEVAAVCRAREAEQGRPLGSAAPPEDECDIVTMTVICTHVRINFFSFPYLLMYE